MRLISLTAWVFALPAAVMSMSTSPYGQAHLIGIAAYGALLFAAGWIAGRWTMRRKVSA